MTDSRINCDGRPVVVHVRCVTGFGGGPEKTIINSPRFLTKHGYDAFCAYMHPPNDPGFATLETRAVAAQAPLVSIPDRGFWDWRVVVQLIRLCRERKAAIWHGHDYKSNVLGLVVRRFWPMQLITTVHGWVDKSGRMPLYDAIDRRALRFYRGVICVSDDLYQQCLDLKLSPERVHLIRNAIDTDEFRRERTADEAKIQLVARRDRILVGAVGRLAAEKGFDLLIRAVSNLIDEGLPIDLWIAGEGPARADLERTIVSTGHERHIRLLGHVADPKLLFEALDVFVLSSLREGLPNVVLEAMALGVPVVSTRVAGLPALIEDGVTGQLVEIGNVTELQGAIHRLANDGLLRRELAHAAHEKVERDYSFAERMRRVVKVYNSLLGRTEPADELHRSPPHEYHPDSAQQAGW